MLSDCISTCWFFSGCYFFSVLAWGVALVRVKTMILRGLWVHQVTWMSGGDPAEHPTGGIRHTVECSTTELTER